jgi:hypothetical protein
VVVAQLHHGLQQLQLMQEQVEMEEEGQGATVILRTQVMQIQGVVGVA